MLYSPIYDPAVSYDENYEKGPFGAFADGKIVKPVGEPQNRFLGFPISLPFGIPAGPLINSNFIKGAFEKGFDVCVYKTVRSGIFPCHPFPNVLSVNVEGDLTPAKQQGELSADTNYHEPLSITNSFGVPSKKVEIWQEDVKKALSYEEKGQLLILSFMGTVRPDQTQEEFIEDYARAAEMSNETGVKALEVNLSCPNIGNEGLVCYNLEVTQKVCEEIRKKIGNTPLILKVGYYQNEKDLERLAEIAKEYANAVSAINTLQTTIVDQGGNQALPGPNRLKSGVCGAAIKWAGLEMTQKLSGLREKLGARYEIVGVGGVTVAEDYSEYRDAGADCVMSATGAMWNPYLAQEIKKLLQN